MDYYLYCIDWCFYQSTPVHFTGSPGAFPKKKTKNPTFCYTMDRCSNHITRRILLPSQRELMDYYLYCIDWCFYQSTPVHFTGSPGAFPKKNQKITMDRCSNHITRRILLPSQRAHGLLSILYGLVFLPVDTSALHR
jgi:hypothetical protein